MATYSGDLASIFSPGVVVGAYPNANRVPSGPPAGTPTATGTVAADGTLSITGLADGTSYFLVGLQGSTWRYVSFTSAPVVSGGGGGGVTPAELAAAIGGLQPASTAATDIELAAEASARTSGDAAKQDAATAATDAELASEAAARVAADVLKQDASTAATDAELAGEAATRAAADLLAQPAALAATDVELAAEAAARAAADVLKQNISDAMGLAIPAMEMNGTSWGDPVSAVTDPSYKWPNVLGQMAGMDEGRITNLCVAGGQAFGASYFGGAGRTLQDRRCQPDMVAPANEYMSFGGIKAYLGAFNDYTLMGDTPSSRTAVEHGLVAQYAALRRAKDIQRTSFSTTGVWTDFPDTTISMGTGLIYTTANGATFDVTVDLTVAREGVAIFIPSINGTGGIITFTDVTGGGSVALGTYDLAADATALAAAGQTGSGGLGAFYVPKGVLPAGTRVIRGVVSGLSGANYSMVTGASICGDADLILPLLPHRKNATINYDAQMTWANVRNQNASAAFTNVTLVDSNPYLTPGWNGVTNSTSDELLWVSPADVHLSDEGDAAFALMMYQTLKAVITPAKASRMRYRLGRGLGQHLNSYHDLIADGNVNPGDALVQSTTDGRVKTSTTANDPLVFGVAANAAIAGTTVTAALPGSVIKVNKTAPALAVGAMVATSTTAGKAAIATPAHGAVLGKTLQAAAINTTEVWIRVTST